MKSANECTFGPWRIYFDPPPIPVFTMDWHYWHEDDDGAPDGSTARSGSAESLQACLNEIHDLLTEQDERETVWLIEMVQNGAPLPRWWNPSKFKSPGWVWDANQALRFPREQDAQDFLNGHAFPIGGKPVEHVFLRNPAALSRHPTGRG